MVNLKHLSRRAFLKAFGLTIPALTLSTWSCGGNPSESPTPSSPGQANPIVQENSNPGTTDWVITHAATNHEIEAYASLTSVDRGQKIQIFVNTSEPSYQLDVFRLGWYGGAGGRRVFGPVTLQGIQQVFPVPDAETGLIECDWKTPYTLQTQRDWTTGAYLVKLTTHRSNKQSYVLFTLRDDAGQSPFLFQTSVTTYQAYNAWGGKSLYTYNSTGNVAALKVSFNRPYDSGHGAGQVFLWELSLLRFLEREGYDVAYSCNITTHTDVSMLRNRRAFLSVGHDEYWSSDMRKNVTAARDQGIHLGFFGADCCYWQIRLEPSSLTGQPHRTIVCYKNRFHQDPFFGIDNSRVSTLWRSSLVNQPEEQLIGVQYAFYPVNTDLVVSNARHFLFEETGLNDGDRLPGLLGYEADRSFGSGPTNLVRLCHSPITLSGAETTPAEEKGVPSPRVGYSAMTMYTAPSGALVFATGSMQFNWGLDDGTNPSRAHLVNPTAQRMVRNLFKRFG